MILPFVSIVCMTRHVFIECYRGRKSKIHHVKTTFNFPFRFSGLTSVAARVQICVMMWMSGWWCGCRDDDVDVGMMMWMSGWWCGCRDDDVDVGMMMWMSGWWCGCRDDDVDVGMMMWMSVWWCGCQDDDVDVGMMMFPVLAHSYFCSGFANINGQFLTKYLYTTSWNIVKSNTIPCSW